MSRQTNLLILPVAFFLLSRMSFDSSPPPWQFVAACSFIGAFLGNYPMDRETHGGWVFRAWLHYCTVPLSLQFAQWILLFITIELMPRELSLKAGLIAVAFASGSLLLTYGLGLRVLRLCRLLRAPSPRLQALVEQTCAAMKVPVRATWELISPTANAFAFIMTRELAFSSTLVVNTPDDELASICAHELGHISEDRWVRASRLVGSFLYFPFVFIRPAYAMYQQTGLIGIYLLFTLIFFGRTKLSRAMEKRADRIAQTSIEDPAVYARALERLYQLNQMPVVLKKSRMRAHPDLYDRMLAANVTPDYERPAPPPLRHWSAIGLGIVSAALGLYLASQKL